MDTEHEITIGVKEENGKWKLETNVYDYLPQNACAVISTETLGMAFEPEQKYENPDGTPIVFRYDYFGNRQGIKRGCGRSIIVKKFYRPAKK